ncbi:outer membrane lipoprotein-sorting protein [Tunturibacter psychrotolerans]|uniref:Outer membrane lipoprotein-sorting protein n=1 Tax=Tunturiibacter psychrotolerans TaxID=3069686 RepID=A0AAU7ZLH2_9BACT
MVTIRRIVASLLFSSVTLGPVALSAVAQPKAGHLDEVLRQMDAASLKFQSAEASFQWDLYEKVVQQTTTQKGTIYFKKESGKTVMGAKVTSPSTKILEYRNGTLTLFDPGTDHETIITPKGNQAQMESFLTLGFGGSGKEMAKAWTISDLGDEMLNGVQTAKLDLVPKDPSVRNNCTHMTIWVDPARGITLKQSFYMPSEDYRTAVYSDVRYNQGVDTKAYQFKTDSKTTVDSH